MIKYHFTVFSANCYGFSIKSGVNEVGNLKYHFNVFYTKKAQTRGTDGAAIPVGAI